MGIEILIHSPTTPSAVRVPPDAYVTLMLLYCKILSLREEKRKRERNG